MKDAIEVSIIFHEGQRMFAVPKHPAPAQEPVAWLDLNKLSDKNMVYATGFKVSDKQSALCLCTPPAQPAPVALTDEQKRELIKNSALWDMHIHIGWYSAPAKSFVEKTIQLIADIEAAHGITEKGQP
jgi:hypothetical protein